MHVFAFLFGLRADGGWQASTRIRFILLHIERLSGLVLLADDISFGVCHLVRSRQRTYFVVTPERHTLLTVLAAHVLRLGATSVTCALLLVSPPLLLRLHILLAFDALLELLAYECIHGLLRIGKSLLFIPLALLGDAHYVIVLGDHA